MCNIHKSVISQSRNVLLLGDPVEEAKLNNRSTCTPQNFAGKEGFMKRSALGYNFTLTPLLLMLLMFFTTLHTLSQHP